MKKNHVPSGSDISAGTYRCNNCGKEIQIGSKTSLPPCARCHGSSWSVVKGVGDAKKDPYPKGK
ncbi:hypothetical protein V6C53_04980 [Desulfocurvibacter africanus]|uniref:zinc ribbon-containing protein n=1 Tax=Desulfocurvibacter africanus TaxID=873 RepID=UPI002FDB7A55